MMSRLERRARERLHLSEAERRAWNVVANIPGWDFLLPFVDETPRSFLGEALHRWRLRRLAPKALAKLERMGKH